MSRSMYGKIPTNVFDQSSDNVLPDIDVLAAMKSFTGRDDFFEIVTDSKTPNLGSTYSESVTNQKYNGVQQNCKHIQPAQSCSRSTNTVKSEASPLLKRCFQEACPSSERRIDCAFTDPSLILLPDLVPYAESGIIWHPNLLNSHTKPVPPKSTEPPTTAPPHVSAIELEPPAEEAEPSPPPPPATIPAGGPGALAPRAAWPGRDGGGWQSALQVRRRHAQHTRPTSIHSTVFQPTSIYSTAFQRCR